MEFEKKPEDIPSVLREVVESEVAKPGLEPFHDELALALELQDELPSEVVVGGQVIPTAVLLEYIDDLRDHGEEEEKDAESPAEEQEGMVGDFMPDSAIAMGVEVPDARNDDDYFFSAARKRYVEEEEAEEPDEGGGGGGGGGDDKPKPDKTSAAATPTPTPNVAGAKPAAPKPAKPPGGKPPSK
jgi:hypothetical protein